MKKLIISIIALFIASVAVSQNYGMKYSQSDPAHYFFGTLAIDVNQNFGLWDNPRMEKETVGFQWQADAGIRVDWIEFYGSYGKADFINYMSWGAGINLYPGWFSEVGLDLSAGIALSMVHWKKDWAWNNVGAVAFKAQAQYWVWDNLGFGIRGILQQRNDVSKGWIKEGQIYATYKRDINW